MKRLVLFDVKDTPVYVAIKSCSYIPVSWSHLNKSEPMCGKMTDKRSKFI